MSNATNARACIEMCQRQLAEPEWGGGTIERVAQIFKDYGFDDWDTEHCTNRFFHESRVNELEERLGEYMSEWGFELHASEIGAITRLTLDHIIRLHQERKELNA